jgi:hypothetical protein
MSAQQICSNACTRILFIARGPRQPACIFETKTGREFSTRSSQKKRERALLKQESTADSTLVPHMRITAYFPAKWGVGRNPSFEHLGLTGGNRKKN